MQHRSSKTPLASAVALGFLFVLASGVDPVRAQLGITGFSFFDGLFEGRLGSTFAVGDFNADGFDDLAVGEPETDVEDEASAGMVLVFLGGPGGWSGLAFLTSVNLGGFGEAGARFGSALTVGDFDDDGHDDLVIGVPGRTINGADSAGEIIVAYGNSALSMRAATRGVGGPLLFDVARTQIFSQIPLPGVPEEDDRFGSTLAAGDLSADGVDDLAIGIPLEDVQAPLGLREDAGAVNVMYGLAGAGLTTTGSQLITEESPGVDRNAHPGERFGFSLAIGQLTSSGGADLAVGAPGEAVTAFEQQGAVLIFPGAPGGLDPIAGGEAFYSQQTDGILGTVQIGDEFGYALATGDFDGDLLPDLAIGVPGESELGTTESGAVQVLYGGLGGLAVNRNQFFVESTIDADVDAFDRLGMALAAGDFDGDGRDDLAMGAPLDNSLGFANAGEVTVLYGTPAGVSFAGHQIFDMIFFDTLEIGDLFGTALAVGRFFSRDNDGQELAVGIPRRGTPVGSEPGASLLIRSLSIFADSFESGDFSDWSTSSP